MSRQQRVIRQSCPDNKCQMYGQSGKGNVIRYGFFRLKRGKRRRYRCKVCGGTFCSTTGTVYHHIHSSRNTFDEVCSLSVEGLSKSAIAKVKNSGGHIWLRPSMNKDDQSTTNVLPNIGSFLTSCGSSFYIGNFSGL